MEAIEILRSHFQTKATQDLAYRKQQLVGLTKFLDEKKQMICDALFNDLHKSEFETLATEILVSKQDVTNIINNLYHWTKGHKMSKNMLFLADSGHVQLQPYGIVLIIAPFNYPIQLIIQPLAGAIAAGNCVLLKPSELAPHVEKLVIEELPKYVDSNCLQFVTGGPKETSELLENRFDHIFYTGSPNVGRIIMTAAAKHLTPVTLELGGKSPCYIDSNVDVQLTCKRILWGKMLNAGQTCVAPDYILCHASVKDEVVKELKSRLFEFYGTEPQESADFARMINTRHWNRVMDLLKQTKGKIAHGGNGIEELKYIDPTVVEDVPLDDSLMQSELFGPVLPIVTVKTFYEAIDIINSNEKPLAAYIFSKSNHVIEEFEHSTTSGSMCSNDCVCQTVAPGLPFGGVGTSGIGSYHGRYSIDTFSHKRAVVHKETKMEFLNDTMKYPPWNKTKQGRVEYMLKSGVKGKYSCNVM